ncbi:hypothetical protein AB1A64_10890 [Ruegeria sp. ANG10]|uniref:hypothetical protein n=1 Tax=Ruegeria sp. ANG10 TaxID=3042467 RepID=UPI00345398D1
MQEEEPTFHLVAEMNAFEGECLLLTKQVEDAVSRDQIKIIRRNGADIYPCSADRNEPTLTHASIKSPQRTNNPINWEIFE